MAAEIVDTVERELGRKPSHCKTAETVLSGSERGVEIASLIRADPTLAKSVVPGLPYTMAELRYAVENEMAVTLSDLLIRRTRVAFETRDHGAEALQSVADLVAPLRKWSADRLREQIEAYDADVQRVLGVSPGAV
jgi:Glycerol-3-phosphate dehydrogenase